MLPIETPSYSPMGEIQRMLPGMIAAAVFLSAATIDLLFLLRPRKFRRTDWRTFAQRFARLPWREPDAILLLFAFGILYFPGILGSLPSPSEIPAVPGTFSLLIHALLLQGTPLLLVAWRMHLTGATARDGFVPGATGARMAALRGLVWGLAVAIPTYLLSVLSHIGFEAFGMPRTEQPVIAWVTDPATAWHTRLLLVGLAVAIAPIGEEVLFRGVLFPVLLRARGLAGALWLSSFFFALVHLHGPSVPPLTLMSMALCAGYLHTGHLLTPIVMHSVLNSISLLALWAAAN